MGPRRRGRPLAAHREYQTARRHAACRSGDDDAVSLVLTSPPFALRRRKAYGNVEAAEYVEWFWPFAEQIYRVLRPDGSLVLDLGGTWNRGSGTRSLYQYELVLRLCPIGCRLLGLVAFACWPAAMLVLLVQRP